MKVIKYAGILLLAVILTGAAGIASVNALLWIHKPNTQTPINPGMYSIYLSKGYTLLNLVKGEHRGANAYLIVLPPDSRGIGLASTISTIDSVIRNHKPLIILGKMSQINEILDKYVRKHKGAVAKVVSVRVVIIKHHKTAGVITEDPYLLYGIIVGSDGKPSISIKLLKYPTIANIKVLATSIIKELGQLRDISSTYTTTNNVNYLGHLSISTVDNWSPYGRLNIHTEHYISTWTYNDKQYVFVHIIHQMVPGTEIYNSDYENTGADIKVEANGIMDKVHDFNELVKYQPTTTVGVTSIQIGLSVSAEGLSASVSWQYSIADVTIIDHSDFYRELAYWELDFNNAASAAALNTYTAQPGCVVEIPAHGGSDNLAGFLEEYEAIFEDSTGSGIAGIIDVDWEVSF